MPRSKRLHNEKMPLMGRSAKPRSKKLHSSRSRKLHSWKMPEGKSAQDRPGCGHASKTARACRRPATACILHTDPPGPRTACTSINRFVFLRLSFCQSFPQNRAFSPAWYPLISLCVPVCVCVYVRAHVRARARERAGHSFCQTDRYSVSQSADNKDQPQTKQRQRQRQRQ